MEGKYTCKNTITFRGSLINYRRLFLFLAVTGDNNLQLYGDTILKLGSPSLFMILFP